MDNKTTAEKWAQHLAERIYDVYGSPKRLATPEAAQACWRYILDAESAGDDVKSECANYLDWLKYARMHQKEENPPKSAPKACLEIQLYAGKACAWSKFKRTKSSAFKPKHNPYLHDDREPEAIPTDAELATFSEQLRAIFTKTSAN